MQGLTHIASSFEVLELSVRRSGTLAEHADWLVGYAPESEADDDARFRVVIATLHAGADHASGSVTVSAVFNELAPGQPQLSELEEQIRESDALEGLYDFAKAILQPALTQVGGDWRLPDTAPEAELRALERVVDERDSAASSPETGDAEA